MGSSDKPFLKALYYAFLLLTCVCCVFCVGGIFWMSRKRKAPARDTFIYIPLHAPARPAQATSPRRDLEEDNALSTTERAKSPRPKSPVIFPVSPRSPRELRLEMERSALPPAPPPDLTTLLCPRGRNPFAAPLPEPTDHFPYVPLQSPARATRSKSPRRFLADEPGQQAQRSPRSPRFHDGVLNTV